MYRMKVFGVVSLKPITRVGCLLIAIAFGFAARAAEPVFISEFLASNNGGLRDEDGDAPDWIEIFNSAPTNVNMNGWFLTDNAGSLSKWRFPSTNIAPNGFLIVFASGKNRAVAGATLHANFQLNAGGEYLALVHPDGATIANEFAPAFPEQFQNISYGIGQNVQVTKLVSNTSLATVFVPTNGTLGTTWTGTNFNDASWRAGTNGVGYETYVSGFAIRNIRANTGVCDLGTADSVLVTPSMQAGVFTETRNVVNYVNTDSSANFGGDFTFPGMTIGVDENNFVTEATGLITIPASGNWTFGVNSDDGFRVDVGANTFSYPSPRGPGDTFATFNLAAGDYPVRLVFYECGGGAEVEFFAAMGIYSSFNASFRLVGDIASGGLAVKSLPTGNNGSIRALIATDVQTNMFSKSPSAYVRLPFTVANPAEFSTLTLRMKYDDGFVVYLNGTEVARRNIPAGTPIWSSIASTNRFSTNALAFEDIDVSGALGLLRAGSNVLAIHGLSYTYNAPDFVVLAELVENKVLGMTNHYFATPSPGAFNGSGFFAFVDNLKFTPGRGWFDTTNFSVTITSATPGITIRYTTNGSAPSETNGLVYSGGILLSGTTIIRAIGYRSGFEPTDPETHSYIFLNTVQAQSTNSGWVGGSSGNYSLDTNVTQGALYGPTFKSDLTNIPTLSIVASWDDMFGPNGVWSNPGAYGVAWERPCSVEYVRPDGKKGFNVNCGIRIQGGVSRSAIPKHGLRLLFKTIYGPGKLDYELYDSPVHEFDTLTLHGSFNDHWLWGGAAATMHRDQWCRDTQNAMGGYGPHGTYVQLFINGLYWGLYNIGEKGDGSYASSYLGGEKEEYDAFNSDELVDGDANAWNTMFGIANAGITNDLAYTNLSQYLNIPNFIDYMMMNFYAANTDWPGHNWNAARRRVMGAGFHFFSWDAEWTFGIGNDVNTDRTGISDGSPGRLYSALRAHPEFRVQFADHAQKYLFNGGALTPSAAQARYQTRSTEIDRAVIGELARWVPGTTRATWATAEANVLSWFPQRTAILVNQLRNAGLYPQLNAPAFAPFGGLVPPNHSLALTNPNASGTIYFTRDGSDPRMWGGAVAASAQPYSTPLVLSNALFLRARVRDGTNWSALVEAPFYVVQDFAGLKVTEIMYNPPNLGTNLSEDLEFLELKNTSTNALDLSGLQFTDGITFSFSNGTRLLPGAFFVLARNTNAFTARYPGVSVNGVYSGKLDNGGEKLTLAHLLGTNVFSFSYNNIVPWPITPDGYGFSLVPSGVNGDPGAASSWRASANLGGSPGTDDPAISFAPVVINEILTHTDPPQLDAIELLNPATTNVNLGGWFLSDDAAAPKKFRVPNGTMISAGGFAVFYETNFNSMPGVPPSFALNSHGESLFLFSGDANTNLTGYSHSFDYGASANGVSFGRYINSVGDEDWPAMASLTLGASNSVPRIGPLVINEVMYHPAIGYDEFVEIVNISSNAVLLYDAAFPTNAWKLSGLGYTFSNNVSVVAGGYLLLVPIDPAAFRSKYSVAPSVQILGPYSGALQDSGERLRLERPDSPDTNGTPYIVVDEVRYNDRLPWPTGADGDGPSLQRSAPDIYGNESTSWFASGITPGAPNVINQPPTVTILSPTNGASFTVPASIGFSASASDPDGTVLRVEYFEGDIKLGEATNAPWSFTWSNPAVGTHAIVAKARDNGLAVTSSSNVIVTVNPPPIGSGIGLRGDYYDNIDFTGTRIRRVDSVVNFDWGGGAPDPSMGAEQFSVRWTGQVQPRFSEAYTFYTVSDDGIRLWVNNQLIIDRYYDQGPTEWSGVISLQAGFLYDIRVEYYENGGGAVARLLWSSPSVAKEVIPSTQLYPPATSNLPPIVTFTSPATGSVFVATSQVNLIADATDPDGAIFKVEFYANGVKIGEDNGSPFGISWTNNSAGAFTLQAVAIDDSALMRTSAPVNVTFVAGFTTNVTLIATGSIWKYFDKGSDLGTAWQLMAFNDSGWSNGPAQLGYGDGDEATRVEDNPTPGYNAADQNRYITTYFRRAFVVTNYSTFSSLTLRLLRDDGGVVYVNGTKVYTNNMPGGAITFMTPASTAIGGADESTFYSYTFDPGVLVPGTNVVAVEIHQSGAGSTDISFDFELTGVQSYLAPYFTTQPQSRSVNAGSNATFSVVASGSAPLFYQWRFNGTNLNGATNASFTQSNCQPIHAGDYAVIVTNLAGTATSQVATLTVVNPDTDGDGLPGWWENAYGLSDGNASDANLDADGDGMSNLNEYRSGTNPTNAFSVLKLTVNSLMPPRLQFVAQSNISYSVQFNSNLGYDVWTNLSNISGQSIVRTALVVDTTFSNDMRFYRVVTPQQP
jgi:hypothetical protein